MGMLAALQARLGDECDGDGDGYYVRTKANAKLGPMTGASYATHGAATYVA